MKKLALILHWAIWVAVIGSATFIDGFITSSLGFLSYTIIIAMIGFEMGVYVEKGNRA